MDRSSHFPAPQVATRALTTRLSIRTHRHWPPDLLIMPVTCESRQERRPHHGVESCVHSTICQAPQRVSPKSNRLDKLPSAHLGKSSMTELLHMMSNDETWRWQEQSRYYPAVQRNNQNTSTTSSSSERALQHGRRWEAPAYTGNHLVISVPGEYPSNHVQQHQYDNYQYARRQASEATNPSVRDPMEYMYPTVQRGEGYFNDLLPVHDEFEDVRILQAMLLAPDAEEEESKDARMPATAYHSRLLEEPLVPSMYFHRENDAASYPLLPTASPRRRSVHNDHNQSPSPVSDVSLPSLQSSRRTTKLPSSRICRVPGCTKGIRSRGLCKAHGGGRRCTTPGCTISDQGGGHCIAHGGGKRCTIDGCEKSAQYKGLCKVHGGSRRCRVPDCSKNGQVKGLCRLHYSQSLQQEQGEDSDRANV